MEIVDFHTHIYPDKIAEKATKSIGGFYNIEMDCQCGMLDGLLESGGRAGVTHYVALGVATVPQQVEGVNNFLAQVIANHPNIYAYAALHPDMENIEAEVDRVISLGFKGIKLHPDFQKFAIDDKKTISMLEHVEGRLPLLIHAGDNRYGYSNPKQIIALLDALPKITFIGAHFGGYSVWDEAARLLCDRGIYVDCCSSLAFISEEKAREYIKAFTPERVLFGSDFPMWDHERELERLQRVVTDSGDYEKIVYKNAKRLLNIT